MSEDTSSALDGSVLEGGGQVVRLSVALSVLLFKPVSIVNIRHNRRDPGLKAQHAAGLRLAADICSGTLTGCTIGSSTIEFHPGPIDPFQIYTADPGTAGSTTLLLQIALPCLLFSPDPPSPIDLTLRGGTNANQAPQIDYTEHIFLPFLRRHLKLDPRLVVRKRGYYPKGGGEIHFAIPTITGPLPAFTLIIRGRLKSIRGKAWVAGLPRSVTNDMRSAAISTLLSSGLGIGPDMIVIEAVREKPQDAVGSGSGVVLWADTEEGCRLAGSCIGMKGKLPAGVGQEAAEELIRNLAHGGCVDEYLQDQIIVFMALAEGKSTLTTGPLTLHTKTAIWVTERLTDARFSVEDVTAEGPVTISCDGIGFRPPSK